MLKTISVTNFRAYWQRTFELGPDVTLVVGPNASGKTNFLESLYVLAVTKSFRAGDKELIRHGQDHFRLQAEVDGATIALGYAPVNGRYIKKVTHDGVHKSLSEHVGYIQTVLFEPSDLGLVFGAPEPRRRYLDFILCQTDPAYLKSLQGYRRVLKQRNSLLANFDISSIKSQLFAWDIKLAELAVEVYEGRRQLIQHINEIAEEVYGQIAGKSEKLQLGYKASVKTGDYSGSFMQALNDNLMRDMAAGFTTIGPHREDFVIHFKDSDITSVASRGEVRTVVLALKMSELLYVQKRSGKLPLLLLDDVFSELDESRRRFLTRRLSGYQSVITTTEADALKKDFKGEYVTISTQVAKARGKRG